MPWWEVTRMRSREEFVKLAMQAGANRRALCRRFGIAPKTGYKWLLRYAEQSSGGLMDRSRQPRHSPMRTALLHWARAPGCSKLFPLPSA